MTVIRRQFITPRELRPIEPAARRELEFSLGRQVLARPLGISFGVCVGDMDNRTIVSPVIELRGP